MQLRARWAAECASGTLRQWHRAGRPDLADWQAPAAPLPPGGPPPACRIGYCSLWTRARRCSATATTSGGRTTGVPISMSSPPPARTRVPARSTSTCGGCPPGSGWRCSTSCSAAATSRTRNCRPGKSTRSSAVLAAAGASSLLEQPEEWWTALDAPRNGRGWRPFILDARRRVEALAFGAGWDTEYPRDIWRLCNLGIDQPEATISFAGDPPALAEGPGQEIHPLAAGHRADRPARPGPGPGP